MKMKWCLTLVLLLAGSCEAQNYQIFRVDRLKWGSSGVQWGEMNVSPDGSLNLQSVLADQRSAIDLRPTLHAVKPRNHAVAEFVVYSCDDAQGWERSNWSEMAHGDWALKHVRFGIERGGQGRFRPIVFSYEDITPGNGLEVLVIRSPDPDVQRPILPSNRVVIEPALPAAEASGLGVMFNFAGEPVFRVVEAGLPDSAGPGFRMLRIRN